MNLATRSLRAPLLALALAATAGSAWPLDLAREDVRAFAAEMKDKHGFDAAWLDAVLADAAIQPRIIELMTEAGRGSDALARVPQPFPDGRAHRCRRRLLERAPGRHRSASPVETGVAPHVIVGIIGRRDLLRPHHRQVPRGGRARRRSPSTTRRAPATSGPSSSNSCCSRARSSSTPRRSSAPTRAPWATGSSCRAATATWAVDGDGDGKRDLWGSWPDVIASVANYLADHGWRAGEPVVVPASLWFPDRRRPRRRQARAGLDREVAARSRARVRDRPGCRRRRRSSSGWTATTRRSCARGSTTSA